MLPEKNREAFWPGCLPYSVEECLSLRLWVQTLYSYSFELFKCRILTEWTRSYQRLLLLCLTLCTGFFPSVCFHAYWVFSSCSSNRVWFTDLSVGVVSQFTSQVICIVELSVTIAICFGLLELLSNSTHLFGQELIVLHTTPSMLGKFLVHAWRQSGGLKENTFYISS